MITTAERYHDFSAGHRVVGHEGKCRHLHGHNYRVHFEVKGELDEVGRVLDFSVIKSKLCQWLEDNWDHKFLVWDNDSLLKHLRLDLEADTFAAGFDACTDIQDSFVWVPFNPTAENMAEYLVEYIGPEQLEGTGCTLIRCTIEETRKCSATYRYR